MAGLAVYPIWCGAVVGGGLLPISYIVARWAKKKRQGGPGGLLCLFVMWSMFFGLAALIGGRREPVALHPFGASLQDIALYTLPSGSSGSFYFGCIFLPWL